MDNLITNFGMLETPYAIAGGIILLGFIVAISIVGYMLEKKIRRDMEREGLEREAKISPVNPVPIMDFTMPPPKEEERERRAA